MPKNKQQRKPILDVIDGNNWLNRAYYAAPKLTTSKGVHTGAVKAFVQMINKLIRHRFDTRGECHLVVAFDNKTRDTWRSKEMASFLSSLGDDDLENKLPEKFIKGYKGTRTQTDEKASELGPQFEMAALALEARGIKHLRVDGYEADDIIGTFAHKAGCLVMIHSRDKDFAQLLRSTVRITQPEQGNSPEVLVTKHNCLELFGVAPSKFVDLLALCGDGCDNIPGVPGVGEKTAIKLLNEHGNIKGILRAAQAGEIKGVLGKKLADPFYISLIKISHRLAAISTSVRIDTDYSSYKLRPVIEYEKQMNKLARRLEFKHIFTV